MHVRLFAFILWEQIIPRFVTSLSYIRYTCRQVLLVSIKVFFVCVNFIYLHRYVWSQLWVPVITSIIGLLHPRLWATTNITNLITKYCISREHWSCRDIEKESGEVLVPITECCYIKCVVLPSIHCLYAACRWFSCRSVTIGNSWMFNGSRSFVTYSMSDTLSVCSTAIIFYVIIWILDALH